MKTYQPVKKDIKRGWHLVDAEDQPLGRLASQVATFLMGKHKPIYSANIDVGDNVVVINAINVLLTGKKNLQKVYRSHSGYPGGLKEVAFAKMIKEQPEKVIEHAVSGMLPKNRLRSQRMKRLKVYPKEEHPYVDKLKSVEK